MCVGAGRMRHSEGARMGIDFPASPAARPLRLPLCAEAHAAAVGAVAGAAVQRQGSGGGGAAVRGRRAVGEGRQGVGQVLRG